MKDVADNKKGITKESRGKLLNVNVLALPEDNGDAKLSRSLENLRFSKDLDSVERKLWGQVAVSRGCLLDCVERNCAD